MHAPHPRSRYGFIQIRAPITRSRKIHSSAYSSPISRRLRSSKFHNISQSYSAAPPRRRYPAQVRCSTYLERGVVDNHRQRFRGDEVISRHRPRSSLPLVDFARLAWISTEMDSANIMSLGSTIFRAFRSEATVTCYASWCADSLVARRHFALSRFDFRSFRVSGGKMTPGRDGYQSTNMPNTNERIPESHESLADSNVRGICFRGNPG